MKLSPRTSGATLAALAISSVLPAFAKESPEQIAGRKVITGLYARIDKDARKRDLRVLASTVAPDFMYQRTNGQTLNRAQFISWQTGAVATMASINLISKIQKFEWRGNDAIVYVDATTRYNQQGASVVDRCQSRDFWSKTKKGWMIRQSVELKKQTFINGEPVREVQ